MIEQYVVILYLIRLVLFYPLIQMYKRNKDGMLYQYLISLISAVIGLIFIVTTRKQFARWYDEYWKPTPIDRKIMYLFFLASVLYGAFVTYFTHRVFEYGNNIKLNSFYNTKNLISLTYGIIVFSIIYIIVILYNKIMS
jgi:hypothetical protein